MQRAIYIRDELVLEAHPEGPYTVLHREGEPGAVRISLNEVRYLADASLVSKRLLHWRWRCFDCHRQ